MTKASILIALTLLLGACSTTERFAVPDAPAGKPIRVGYGSVVVRDVSLPEYASSQEIYTRAATGALTSSPKLIWADLPQRAITLELARYLTQVTGAEVASEPWPFPTGPDAAVEVRVESLYADTVDGTLHLSGQYFVSSETGRSRMKIFNLKVPVGGEQVAPDIAAARGVIVRDLARAIAADGLR